MEEDGNTVTSEKYLLGRKEVLGTPTNLRGVLEEKTFSPVFLKKSGRPGRQDSTGLIEAGIVIIAGSSKGIAQKANNITKWCCRNEMQTGRDDGKEVVHLPVKNINPALD